MTEKAASLVAQAKQWAGYYGEFANGEEGAVYTAPLRLRAAWDDGDAAAIAGLFTDNGSMLVGDEQLHGPEQIRGYLSESFTKQHKGTKFIDEPVQIKFLAPGVAFVVTRGGLVPEGQEGLGADDEVRATWVARKEAGNWKLVSYQTSPIKG
jgi:uncharacterized protein (TIGR02246 family)